MLPRFHWSDITTVGHYLGVLILMTGAAMCVPAVIALVFGEFRQLGAFVAGIGVCLTLGSALRFFKARGLDRRRALLLVGFGWIVIGFVCAVPLLLSGSFDSWFDALFDSVSALTTTGVTLVSDVDAMSYSQVTWRVVMSFAGALTVIIIAMYSGFFGEGSRVFMMAERRDGERTRARISDTCLLVLRVYGSFALVGAVAATLICLFLGLHPVDAIMNGFWLALTAIGTGGFVPHTSDLVYYHSLPLQFVLSALMIAGAIGFGVYAYARVRRFKHIRRNAELRMYALWIVVLVAFVTWIMTREGLFTSLGGLMQNGLSTVVSAATTCGMQAVYPEQIGGTITDGVVILVIVAILFGACAYSSGGGIKFVRILQVLRWIKYSILVRLAPDNARVRIKHEHFGSQSLSSEDAMVAMTVFILYLGTAALGSMAFIAYGNDALNSVFEAISYVTNCGMTTEITQAGLPFGLKVVALLLMWAGRVEFIALIAAIVGIIISIHPENLFSNDRSRELRTLKSKNSGGTAWRRRKRQESGQRGKTLAVAGLLVLGLACGGIAAPSALAVSGGAQVPVQDVEALSNPSTYSSVDIRSLLSAGKRQDGRDVSFTGEAVGSPIVADADHVWVNVKGGGAMVGVYMDAELAKKITHYAAYEQTGDMITVSGTYHLACPDHNGELEVHAEQIEINAEGESWTSSVNPAAYAVGFVLIVVGVTLTLVRQSLRGRVRFRDLFKWERS